MAGAKKTKKESLPKTLRLEVLEGANNNFVLYKTFFSKKDFSRKVKGRDGKMTTTYSVEVFKEIVDSHTLTLFIARRHRKRVKEICNFFSMNKAMFLGTNLIGTNVLFEAREM